MSETTLTDKKLKSALSARMHLNTMLQEADKAIQEHAKLTANCFPKGFGTKSTIELAKQLIHQSLDQLDEDI